MFKEFRSQNEERELQDSTHDQNEEEEEEEEDDEEVDDGQGNLWISKHPLSSYLILSCLVLLSLLISSHSVLYCLIDTSHHQSSIFCYFLIFRFCPVMSCPFLFYSILFYFILTCFIYFVSHKVDRG